MLTEVLIYTNGNWACLSADIRLIELIPSGKMKLLADISSIGRVSQQVSFPVTATAAGSVWAILFFQVETSHVDLEYDRTEQTLMTRWHLTLKCTRPRLGPGSGQSQL